MLPVPFSGGSEAMRQLGSYIALVPIALAAIILVFVGIGRWRCRLRTDAEHAAALALMRAPDGYREALCTCRSQIIESGETPPGFGGAMDAMIALDAAIRDVLPATVARYRSASVLTGSLLQQIEADVLKQLAFTGQHSEWVRDLVRATPRWDYRENDGPAIEGCGNGSIVQQAIERAWRLAEDEKGWALPFIERSSSDSAANATQSTRHA